MIAVGLRLACSQTQAALFKNRSRWAARLIDNLLNEEI